MIVNEPTELLNMAGDLHEGGTDVGGRRGSQHGVTKASDGALAEGVTNSQSRNRRDYT